MSLWFLLWFALSAVLLGATAWSTVILIQQKKAWKEYAQKKGLTFVPNKFFEPCTVEGFVDGYSLSFFTATQQHEDSRKNRQLTVMEVTLEEPFVDGIACATQGVLPFLQTLDAVTPHEVKAGTWDKKHYIRSRNKKAVDVYLTEDRVKILNSILSMPKADILILLNDTQGVFRFETTNPLTDVAQIDSVINKLIVRIGKLRLDAEALQNIAAAMPSEKPAET